MKLRKPKTTMNNSEGTGPQIIIWLLSSWLFLLGEAASFLFPFSCLSGFPFYPWQRTTLNIDVQLFHLYLNVVLAGA